MLLNSILINLDKVEIDETDETDRQNRQTDVNSCLFCFKAFYKKYMTSDMSLAPHVIWELNGHFRTIPWNPV